MNWFSTVVSLGGIYIIYIVLITLASQKLHISQKNVILSHGNILVFHLNTRKATLSDEKMSEHKIRI